MGVDTGSSFLNNSFQRIARNQTEITSKQHAIATQNILILLIDVLKSMKLKSLNAQNTPKKLIKIPNIVLGLNKTLENEDKFKAIPSSQR